MYLMKGFSALRGRKILDTRSFLLSKSQKRGCHFLAHVTEDHGVLLFNLTFLDYASDESHFFVQASPMDCYSCLEADGFREFLKENGITGEELDAFRKDFRGKHAASIEKILDLEEMRDSIEDRLISLYNGMEESI